MMRHGFISISVFLMLLAAFGAVSESDDRPCVLLSEGYGKQLPASDKAVAVWWTSSGWKVAKTTGVPKRGDKAASIGLASNETEAFQLVIRPQAALTGFMAAATALEGPDGAVISADQVEVLRVRYVNIERPSDKWGMKGWWPDPLPPFKGGIDLEAGVNQPLWVRIHAPKGTPAGEYRGMVQLRGDGFSRDVPVRVRVYGFALPDRLTCSTAFGFDSGAIYRYQGLTDPAHRWTVLQKYLASLSAHHISPYNPAPEVDVPVTWVKLGADEGADLPAADRALLQANALTPRFDWAAWDAEVQRTFDTYHFQSFRLGIPGIGGGDMQGFPDGSRERDLAFTRYAQAVQEHLREKGWLDEAYVYWFDEPTPSDYPHVLAGFERLKKAAPDIRRMLTEQPGPELKGGPNLWCPMNMSYIHKDTLPFRADGDRFWWYVCTIPKKPFCGLFIDHPGTALRTWLWQTWQNDIEGILIWQSNLWTTGCAYPDADAPQNPYEDPMSWMHGYGTKPGDKKPWGNGDGRFMYPPEAAADAHPAQPVLDGPVDCIRWEMLRDGLEDYEYFVMLKGLIAQHKDALSAREVKRYEELLAVPAEITSDLRHYSWDPAPLEAQRAKMAKAIEKLAGK